MNPPVPEVTVLIHRITKDRRAGEPIEATSPFGSPPRLSSDKIASRLMLSVVFVLVRKNL